MVFNTAESLTLIGLLLTFAIAGWGIIRYFLNKLDEVYKTMSAKERSLNKEISNIHNNYIKRDEVNAHMSRVDIGITQLNARFDQLMAMLVNNKGANNDN